MAALVFSLAGAALGNAFLGPLGAVAGRLVGALAGNVIDQALFGNNRPIEGPRLSDLDVMASSEGAPIPRVYGRARLAGQVIWATRLEEVASSRSARTVPSARVHDSDGPQTGHAFGCAWKRRLRGLRYSASQAGHIRNPRIVVFARS